MSPSQNSSQPDDFFDELNDFLNLQNLEYSEENTINIGCDHSMWDLSFNANDQMLSCENCSEEWGIDPATMEGDAFLNVWHSAGKSLHELGDRLFFLEQAVSENLNLHQCDGCGTWSDSKKMINLGKFYSCTRHLGDVVENQQGSEKSYAANKALEYSTKYNLKIATDLERRILWERMLCASSTVSALANEYINDSDVDDSMTRPLILDDVLAESLQIDKNQTLQKLSAILAEKAETDPPETRFGSVFLLTLLSESLKLKSKNVLDSSVLTVVENSIPLNELVRITTAVDLCGQGIPDGGHFDGAIAEEALHLVAKRSTLTILNLLISAK